MASSPPNNQHVTDVFQRIKDRAEDEELYYDQTTGDLVVKRRGQPEPSPDALPATAFAREGFFLVG